MHKTARGAENTSIKIGVVMLRYMRDEVERLTGFKEGMEKNPTKWANNDITPAAVQTHIEALITKEK